MIFSGDNHKVYTAGGSEGIFEWNFLGDVTTPPPVIPGFGMPQPEEEEEEAKESVEEEREFSSIPQPE